MNVNAQGYERRMEVVHDILRQYGLEANEVTTVEYYDNAPCYFNNYIFKVTLTTPATTKNFPGTTQPCTVAAPAEGFSTAIVRLSNPRAGGMNNTNRVQNEVAAMHLMREAVASLGGEFAGIVPAVYAWKAGDVNGFPDEGAFGWTLMEFKLGVPMDAQFAAMALEEKKTAIGKIASIFAALQAVKLPPAATRHGGLTIDQETGEIVSGQATLAHGGPWDGYADSWEARFAMSLREAGEAELIRGWRDNGVRERIDMFVAERMGEVLRGVDDGRLGLVHSDFTMNNMLYDPETKRITALVDFDWATISHPGQEFLTSFRDLGGQPGSCGSASLKAAILSGNFDAKPVNGDDGDKDEDKAKEAEKWEVARAWDAALRERGAIRPSEVKGMDVLGELNELLGLLEPFLLSHPEWMRKSKSEEEIREKRREAEADLVKALEGFGV